MDYPQVVNWLFNQLANYQKQGTKGYKPGLDNVKALLSALNNPQNQFKSIHIAGTNGKGSTANMLAAIAIENGYRTGLFTSPHIKDFRERITINGGLISKTFVTDFINNNLNLFQTINPSFFEITTVMSFVAFAESNCEIAIIETGLGGRLDATNVLQPDISVITNIGLDHTDFLGNSLSEIAFEKAGIIKKNTPVVIGEILPETKPVFEEKAKNERARIYEPELQPFNLDLLGEYQQRNASTAWKTIQILKQKGLFFDDQKSRAALTRITNLTSFKGRLTIVQQAPLIIADASHNPTGIKTLMKELDSISYEKLHCIYGTANDKDYNESMQHFPKHANYYLTEFDSERALKVEVLAKLADDLSLCHSTYSSPDLALLEAKNKAGADDLILIFGSFFILETII